MTRSIFTQLSGIGRRQHRWLACLLLVMALVGVHATATASPAVIPMADAGGSGSLAQRSPQGAATIRLFDEVLSQRAMDVTPLLMAANAVNHTPAGTFIGPDGFERYVAEAWGAFTDARFSIDEQLSAGDIVTVRWTMTGRNLGKFGDLPATRAEVRLDGLAILRFERGMITESWLQYDRMALVEQIEAAPVARDICPPCMMP